MNLVSDQWIPVLNASGQRQQISLHEAFFQGAQWRDLAVRPHERVAEADMPALEPGADPLSLLPPAPPAEA